MIQFDKNYASFYLDFNVMTAMKTTSRKSRMNNELSQNIINKNMNNNINNLNDTHNMRPNDYSTIKTIMQVTKCDRDSAIKSFERANGDLSMAISILFSTKENSKMRNYKDEKL